jgi:signal transduction histidine kinase
MPFSLSDYEVFLLSNPGILLYHGWILLTALAAAGYFAVKKARREWLRGFLLAGALVLLQLVGLGLDLTAAAWNLPAYSAVFADVDRALGLLSLAGLLWFFLFPRPNRGGDSLTAAWIILILLAAGGTAAYLYLYPSAGAFNGNILSLGWDALRWIACFLGFCLLAVRRPIGWGLSAAAALLFLTGVTLQLSSGDAATSLPGLTRLFNLIAFPIAGMRLAYSAAAPGAVAAGGSGARQARQFGAESISSLTDLLATLEPPDLPRAITVWICSAMRVEAAYFVAAPENGDGVEFISGYDGVGNQPLSGFLVPSDAAPQLHFAVTGREIMRLGKAEAEEGLRPVAEKAQLPQTGPALYVPLPVGDGPALGLLLLAVYSGEEWQPEDEGTAREFAKACGAAFERMHARILLQQRVDDGQKKAAEQQAENERLQTDRMNLETRLEQAEQEWRNERQRAEGLAALVKQQDEAAAKDISLPEPGTEAEKQWMLAVQQKDGWIARLQEELETTRAELLSAQRESAQLRKSSASAESLRAENQRLQDEIRRFQTVTGETPGAAGEGFAGVEITRLRSAMEEGERKHQEEIARLQHELRRTLTEYTHLQSALLQPPPPKEGGKKLTFGADAGMVTGLISEIRQPFSSMVGYTDLLLSESAGILGAMQRKFLDRIRASITRTEALFEDLLQMLLLPEKIAAPRIQPVDVASIIDGAITGASETVREKNLVLHLDVDEDMPPVEIDRDALQQILNHLVQNAVLITPPEKEVVVTSHTPLAEENRQLALLITVKDSGPGISAEDQPRVFTRLYRTEGPLIEGLGDTGVGMAVARTLTEAMGGRIWLESQLGHGTTFFILLPVQVGETPDAEAASSEAVHPE